MVLKPLRSIALASTAVFALILGAAWSHTRPDYSDGPAAIASVASLKGGMSVGNILSLLHPERTRRATVTSYSLHPDSKGGGVIIHPLTLDRYLVLKCDAPRPGSRTGDPTLASWRLVEGSAPRDDVTIGRAFTPGPFKFYY